MGGLAFLAAVVFILLLVGVIVIGSYLLVEFVLGPLDDWFHRK